MSYSKKRLQTEKEEVDELRKIIHGDSPHHKFLSHDQAIFANDPRIKFDHQEYDYDRLQAIEKNIQRTVSFKKVIKENPDIRDVDYTNYFHYGYCGNQMLASSLHHGMFEPMIRTLGSDEQVKQYLDDLLEYKIWGCYAQTEMGHGSDVQGLQTQAILDEEADEFIIHTPDITAAKFWPGELGKLCTHAVIHAKLIIKGEPYGVHAFIAQIRDMETHAPLPGIEVGDIGPKYGFNLKDNGYMIFTNFRVPRSALLSRFVSCSRDGNLSINGDPKVAYSTMMMIRVTLLNLGWDLLIKTICVVDRYLNFRTQFKSIANSDQERKIIDYQSTRHIMVPKLAFGYANCFAGKRMFKMLKTMEQEFKEDKFYTMKELHALGSALKAYYMQETLDAFFEIRETCGGSGYSNFSNLPWLIELWSPNVTLEGDAMVMYQQTGKILFKTLQKIKDGSRAFGTFEYLTDLEASPQSVKVDDVSNTQFLTDVIKYAAIYQIKKTDALLQQDESIEWNVKWNKMYQIEIVKSVKLHAIYATAVMFQKELESLSISDSLKSKLTVLCKIYACDNIIKYCEGAFLLDSVTASNLFDIKNLYEQLIEEATPFIWVYSEGCVMCEDTLHRQDGDFDPKRHYENYYREASNTKLNKKVKLDAVDMHIKPLSKKLKMVAKI